jgi:methionyl-tRNA synthetase
VQQSAAAQGLPAIELCNTNSKKFLDLLRISGVAYDDFVRTTEARHRETAVAMWRAMQDNGHITRQKFSGWYCVSDEVLAPVCPHHRVVAVQVASA